LGALPVVEGLLKKSFGSCTKQVGDLSFPRRYFALISFIGGLQVRNTFAALRGRDAVERDKKKKGVKTW
jgi:hypothetical protein